MRRVVVTGIGMVTPLGGSVARSWDGIVNAKSGVKRIPELMFSVDDLSCKIAAYVQSIEEDGKLGFRVEDYISAKDARTMDRFIHIAIAATDEALKDAGWISTNLNEEQRNKTGVIIGSGIGGLICIEASANALFTKGARRISPFFIPASLVNLAGGQISIRYGLRGPNYSVVSACASGANAIGESAHIISRGDADVMLCGGAEAAICRLGVGGFASARALSTKYNDAPTQASRPWDKGRDGFVMGEGAGLLVLEELQHAKKRGAHVYGELVGYGLSCDAYHMTAPDPEGRGVRMAMTNALSKAQLSVEDIQYINAHGTSTPLGDLIEYREVMRLFNNNKSFVMSSTKSAIGHLLGAAGSVEAIFCLLAMRDGIAPPTLNLDEPEEECDITRLVPHTAIQKKIDVAMSNSFGFGGANASLVFKKLD